MQVFTKEVKGTSEKTGKEWEGLSVTIIKNDKIYSGMIFKSGDAEDVSA